MSCRTFTPPPTGLCRGLTMYHTVDEPNPDPPPPDCTDCGDWATANYNDPLGYVLGGGLPLGAWKQEPGQPPPPSEATWLAFLAEVDFIRNEAICDVAFDFELRVGSNSLPPPGWTTMPVEEFIGATLAELDANHGLSSGSTTVAYFNCDDQVAGAPEAFDSSPRVTPVYHRDVRGDAIGGYFADPTDAAYAALPFKELELTRTHRGTGAPLAPEDGVETDGSNIDWFNGSGTTPVPSDELPIDRDHQGFSVAVYWWPAAANALADQPGGDTDHQPQQIIGLGGERAANPPVVGGTLIYLEDQTAANLQIVVEQKTGQSWMLPTFASNGRAPFMLVSVAHRAAGSLWLTLYRDGAPFGDPIALDPDLIDTDWLTVGDPIKSDGGFHAMAAWCRPLRASEVAFIGTDLSPLVVCDGCVGNFGNPLLTACGRSAIDPGFIVPRSDRSAALVSEGPHRHTRLADQSRPRGYSLRWELDDGHDLEIVRQVIEETKGCTITRWRHPVDDPAGPICEAPRWVILNADQLRQMFTVTRDRPHVAGFTLELEEVI